MLYANLHSHCCWVRKTRKNRRLATSRPSVCPPRISSAPTGRIFVKHDTEHAYLNLSWKFKSDKHQTRVSHTLHAHLNQMYIHWRSIMYINVSLRFNDNSLIITFSSETHTPQQHKGNAPNALLLLHAQTMNKPFKATRISETCQDNLPFHQNNSYTMLRYKSNAYLVQNSSRHTPKTIQNQTIFTRHLSRNAPLDSLSSNSLAS
jgi:hypothetical protein